MSNDKRVYRLLKSKKISVGKAEDGTFLCSIPHNGNKEILDIHSSNFRIAFKSFWKKEYGELLNDKEVQEIISIIEVECYESKNKIQRNHRIYTKGRMLIYQLNTDNNTSVRIEDGECEIEETPDFMKKNSFEKELERKSQVVEDYEKKVDKLKKEVDSIRTEIIKKEQYYKISGLTTEYNKIEILYNFTKDIKKYIWKDSIKTYLEEQNEPTEELDMLCNMMQNIKDRYKAFKKSVRFDGQIIEISGKEYADMVMKYALMLPEYNVKKAEKELQDFKDNKINLLTNKEARKNKVEKVAKGTGEVVKEAIVYTGGSLVKNTIKSILHIS